MKVDYVGYALAVLSLIYAYYLHRKSIRIKEPVYSVKSNNVISGYSSKYQNLSVSYKKRKVENFTVSKILFFNRGGETITRQDIETVNHLRIEARFFDADRFDILDVSILQSNNPSSQFSLSLDRNQDYCALIDFEYLDKNQGAVIEVIHTGLTSDDINIVGDIKGVQKLSQVEPNQLLSNKPMQASEKRILIMIISVSLIWWLPKLFVPDYLNSLLRLDNSFANLLATAIALFGFMATGVLLLLILAYTSRLFRVGSMIPKGLEKFDE